MTKGKTGYQPRVTPAERRAFFDIQRKLGQGGGGGGTGLPPNGATGTVLAKASPADNHVYWAPPAPKGDPGPAGPAGSIGPAGPGVASGGTTGQALTKIDASNYNTQWSTLAASGITFPAGTGNIGASNVEDAIVEAKTDSGFSLNLHINDTTDAHAASAVTFTPTGTIAATNVQAAIEELAVEGGGSGSADTLWVGPSPPSDPAIELWWDSDETAEHVLTQAEADARYMESAGGQFNGLVSYEASIVPASPNHLADVGYVNDQLNLATAAITPATNWTTVSFTNQVTRVGNVVTLEANLTRATSTSATPPGSVATIPAGFRPGGTLRCTGVAGTGFGAVQLTAAGDVSFYIGPTVAVGVVVTVAVSYRVA